MEKEFSKLFQNKTKLRKLNYENEAMKNIKLLFSVGSFLLGSFLVVGSLLIKPAFSQDSEKGNNMSTNQGNQDNQHIEASVKSQLLGKEIYTDFCIQCHGANGKGDAINFPPLAGTNRLETNRAKNIAAVKFGLSGEIVINKIKFNGNMPAMGLSNQEIADVMNYVMTSWGNVQTKVVTEKEVEAIKK
jgi:mono/diheme cytochrome c family protein